MSLLALRIWIKNSGEFEISNGFKMQNVREKKDTKTNDKRRALNKTGYT